MLHVSSDKAMRIDSSTSVAVLTSYLAGLSMALCLIAPVFSTETLREMIISNTLF